MKTLNCVCFPDKRSSKRIRKIMEGISRECNSRNALEFPPHFSLRNDFKTKDNDIENMFSELANILSDYKSFQLKLTTYGFYPWKIIHLNIDKNKALQKLHEKIMNVTQKYRVNWVEPNLLNSKYVSGKQKEYIEKFGYQFAFEYYSPHFTIAGNDMAQETFEKIKSKLSDKKENINLIVEKIAFMDREKNNQIYKLFELKG